MNDLSSKFRALTDAVADTVAREVASLRREAAHERELREAEHRARMAELSAAISSLSDARRELTDRLVTLKDGEDGRDGVDGAAGRDGVDGQPGAAGKDGRDGAVGVDGKDADPVEIVRLLVPEVERRFVENPIFKGATGERGEPGRDADPDAMRLMVMEAVAELPPAKDGRDGASGKDADPEVIRTMVADAVAEIPAPNDGKDGRDGQDGVAPTAEAVVELLWPDAERAAAETAERILGGWEKPRDGKDGVDGRDGVSVTVDDVAPLIEAKIVEVAAAIPAPKNGIDGRDGKDGKNGDRGAEGPIGALPVVKAWEDRVYFQGEVCVFDGASYQASKNTGKTPPHEDWTCIVAKGRDGDDGRSPVVRGTWSASDEYAALDVVALNGAAFIARKDDPGSCPGEGWQMIAAQGKPGKPGPPIKGDPGRPGPPVAEMSVDSDGLLTLTNADGSTVACDLYPLLAKLG